MQILFVKLGAIGDIIHTLPALAVVRSEFPTAEISWVAEERSAEILRGNQHIDNLIEVDTRSLRGGIFFEKMLTGAAKQARNLRQYDFDIAIDFQGLLKSGLISKLSGAKKRWGFAKSDLREPAARVFYTNTTNIDSRSHVVRRNIDLVTTALDFAPRESQISFPIYTADSHREEANEIASRVGGEFALLNPAGGWVTKLWPAENFGQLADRLWETFGVRSIVVTGPKESDLANAVMSASRSGKLIHAEPSLKGFYELARAARVYVGGDTGPTHLAIAAGARVVGLFGPTEWWRNGSLNSADVCVERLDIDCRVDCHRRTCSKWICFDIDVETVVKAVQKRLEVPAVVGG
ncbi:MAG TPA: lipopolysaccharide heptosyltransferase I [Pyrinomonadaceae bacterium]|nr:lipopolysaccharide heptosyltransferase I [Pyrinomonadaceae bacterium]